MKKIVIILLTQLLIVFSIFPEKLAVFSQLEKPDSLYVDDEQIVVGDRTSVFIYSAKDYHLQAKFGGFGEGPEEFLPLPGRGLRIDVQPNTIFIHSLGKISYFKREGKFIKEQRVPPGTYFFRQFADQLLGFKRVAENEIIYETINLFDNNLNLQKELFRHKGRVQQNRREIKVLDRSVVLETGRENIFLSASNFLEVLVFDKKGTLIYTIENKNEKRREVTDRDRKEIHDFLKLKYGDPYLSTKDMVKIPSTYPVIRSRIGLEYDYNKGNQRLYVITWNKKGTENVCLLYDLAGKFLEKVYIEMQSATPILPFPFIIRNGKFYQLVENEDTGNWELFVSEIN
ncbi:MAG: hypothetical protein JSV88_20020 [Candidatus Aminicenantes bacterium]|nr:MAG: hypothetical protein JSV88_20020 [Candidatus Aminicenantes bacterium]